MHIAYKNHLTSRLELLYTTRAREGVTGAIDKFARSSQHTDLISLA